MATNSADPTQFATVTITLSPEAWVRISPDWAVIYAGQTRQFTADNVKRRTWRRRVVS